MKEFGAYFLWGSGLSLWIMVAYLPHNHEILIWLGSTLELIDIVVGVALYAERNERD